MLTVVSGCLLRRCVYGCSEKKDILQQTLDRLTQQRQKLLDDMKPLQQRKEKVRGPLRAPLLASRSGSSSSSVD